MPDPKPTPKPLVLPLPMRIFSTLPRVLILPPEGD